MPQRMPVIALKLRLENVEIQSVKCKWAGNVSGFTLFTWRFRNKTFSADTRILCFSKEPLTIFTEKTVFHVCCSSIPWRCRCYTVLFLQKQSKLKILVRPTAKLQKQEFVVLHWSQNVYSKQLILYDLSSSVKLLFQWNCSIVYLKRFTIKNIDSPAGSFQLHKAFHKYFTSLFLLKPVDVIFASFIFC